MINKQELRETLGGGSFLKKFHQCERSFYYRYIEGLMPESSSEALIFGSALHEAAAKYWDGKDLNGCTLHGLEVIDELTVNYEKNKTDLLHLKLSLVFPELFEVLEELKKEYDHIEHEATYHLRLENGDISIKPDIVLRNKHTGELEIFDYKTTGISIDTQTTNQLYSAQPRLYSTGIKTKYNLNYFPIWNTIEVYSRKIARKDEFNVNIQIVPMSIDEYEIKDVVYSYNRLLVDMLYKYSVYSVTNDFKVFTRLGDCMKCPFKDICKQRLCNVDVDELEGFERDPWMSDGLVEDYLKTGRFEIKE